MTTTAAPLIVCVQITNRYGTAYLEAMPARWNADDEAPAAAAWRVDDYNDRRRAEILDRLSLKWHMSEPNQYGSDRPADWIPHGASAEISAAGVDQLRATAGELAKIERRMSRAREREGITEDIGIIVRRFAEAIGARGITVRRDDPTWTGSRWTTPRAAMGESVWAINRLAAGRLEEANKAAGRSAA